MRIITVTIIAIIMISAVLYIMFVNGIPQTDELVCKVDRGDRFVLKSKFNWFPFDLIPVQPRVRENQTYYTVYYKRRAGEWLKRTPFSIPYSQIDAPGSAENLCAQVGVKNGIPILYLSWMNKDGKWFDWPGIVPDVLYSYTRDGTKAYILKEINDKHIEGSPADFRTARIIQSGSVLVYELPVIDNELNVIAVLQSTSKDNGKNWGKLTLTTNSIIYKLNKNLYAQSFMAKPIIINGDKVIKGHDRKSRGTVNGVRK